MIDIDYVRAGNSIVTVSNNEGKHYTFKFKKKKDQSVYFVSMLTGADNNSDYQYMGVLTDQDYVLATKASKFSNQGTPIKVVNWALDVINGNKTLPDGYDIMHNGHCGRCGRVLTTPESIKTGLGPVCATK